MPKRPIKAEDLLRFVFVGDPQISPDGSRILFSRKHINDKNKYITNLYTVDMEGNVVQWTQGENGASGGRWSPDGHTIAFVSGRDKPGSQIYLLPTTGGEAQKLTSLPEGSLGDFKWSPDGSKIAFTFREMEAGRTEKGKKEREEKGLSTPPWEIDTVWYRLDGDGYFGNQRYELYVFDIATKAILCRYNAAADGAYSFDWNPNSKELAVIHTASKRPFADPPNAQIYRVTCDGQAWQLPGLPKGDKSEPRWSPDGKWIAYAGDVDEEDPWGTRNTKVYVVKADGGEPRDLTGHEDYDMATATLSDSKEAGFGAILEWAPDSSGLYAQIGWQGETQLGFIDLEKGGTKVLTEGNHAMSVGNVSSDGQRIAACWGHPTKLPEIARIEAELATGRLVPRVLTNFNQAFHDEVQLSEPEEVWLDSTDGTKVQTWVMKPIGYKEPKRYPAVLEIHGGPHAQYGWAFFHEFQLLAAEGYVVVFSNPRGSKGYGEAFCAAIRGNWGNKDWEDVQAVTHWMQHQPYIHPGQMGVMGGSYGGYMTNWVIGHCKDYKAAITDRCVSNMVSMAGSSDFPFNKDGYFKGVAWGDLEAIKELWRQSPIAYFEGVTTPTLIIHSEGDLRCNIEQAEQVFTALQQQGVDSRFVRYPSNTSHGMSRGGPPDMRLHRLAEITGWWAKHLK
ncbi:MAG TPA: S9 family peptidase [Fimbriimonadaceae bacterium]|nr:S9 family peptidase [Fimbriimonadaceae bacterium]